MNQPDQTTELTGHSLNDEVVNRWRLNLSRMRADASAMERLTAKIIAREAARKEINSLAISFVDKTISVDQLKDVYHRKTAIDWKCFGFKGFSGAMVLNMLVKNIQDKDALTTLLRTVLSAPGSDVEAVEFFDMYFEFAEEHIESKELSKNTASLARVPFFLSAWWHIQRMDMWPVYYPSVRDAFLQDGLMIQEINDPYLGYIAFCTVFRELRAGLGISSWELESLSTWVQTGSLPDPSESAQMISSDEVNAGAHDLDDAAQAEEKPKDPLHTKLQWQLATLGQTFGCTVWIPATDRGKTYQGDRLGQFSLAVLPPLAVESSVLKIIMDIDVIWLKGSKVEAAFEIECTTSIFSGLLRMSDLTVADPNHTFPLYIVVPESRIPLVAKQLRRPTFQSIDLHQRCLYFSAETLEVEFPNIRKWSTQPNAIKKLAHAQGTV